MKRARYDFFISYAHTDLDRVRRLDRALRDLLRRPLRRTGFQVFRDERRLSAGNDLTERLRSAMRDSQTLLVVVSQASSRSPWVEREVAYWCDELGRDDRMILVRADPTVDLEWDDAANAFRHPDQLIPALVRRTRTVPFYAELGDSASADHDAAVRIAATVLGRAPEEIAGEDFRLQRRRRRLAVSAFTGLAVLTLLAVGASVLAVRSSNVAKRNERRATADALANRAIVEQDDRPDKALALALAAKRLDRASSGRDVLMRLMLAYDRRDRFVRVSGPVGPVAVSPRGDRLALGDDDGGVRVASLSPGAVPAVPSEPALRLGGRVSGLAFADATHLVVATADNRVTEVTVGPSGALRKTAGLAARLASSWAFDRPSGQIAVGGYDSAIGSYGRGFLTLLRWRPGSLTRVGQTSESGLLDALSTFSALAFNRGGTRLLAVHDRQAEVFSTPWLVPAPGSVELTHASFIEGESAAVGADGAEIVGGNPSASADRTGIIEVYGPAGRRRGTVAFELSVDALERCDRAVYFGTRAGEFGRLADPRVTFQDVSQTRPLAKVSGAVRDLACGDRGPLAVTSTGGFMRIRDLSEDRNGFPVAETALSLRAHDDEQGALKTESVLGMSLMRGGSALRTRRGTRVPFIGPDAGMIAAVLRGEAAGPYNCVTAGDRTLIRYTNPTAGTPLVVGRCHGLKLKVSGPFAATLQIRRRGRTIASISAGERVGTYTVALSSDAQQLFVGGYGNGVLYDLSSPAAPRVVATIPGSEVFTGASFAARGDVLVTSETTPHGLFDHVRVQVLGGPPLERLACVLGAGSLADTNAMQLLSADDRADVAPGGTMCAHGAEAVSR